MLFRQFVDDDLGCASYLVGDADAGEAAVVDPAYAIEPYLAEAERQGVRIVRVLETHTHADHVSGHGRFALELGVPVAIHAAAEPEYPFEPLRDGDEIALGDVVVNAAHTPGHRPEHTAFLVADRSRSGEPWLTLTGDSLLVGDAARPDLAVEAEEGARRLFRSIHRLLELADGVELYPGHVAGSLCGAGMNPKRSSTIGFERRFNHRVAVAGEDSFVAAATAAGVRPPNMERIVALNRGPFLAASEPVRPIVAPDGVTVVDVRAPTAFASGHLPGALNVPLDGSGFATKAAFVVSADEPVAIYASSAEQAERAARGLRSVGLLELAGFLTNGETAKAIAPIELDELEQLLAAGAVDVLDVREPHERDAGYIPGSRNVPYRLVRRCIEDIRGERPIVTICESGNRAAVAASVLAAAGVEARPVLRGGVPEWQARGNETVSFRRCGS